MAHVALQLQFADVLLVAIGNRLLRVEPFCGDLRRGDSKCNKHSDSTSTSSDFALLQLLSQILGARIDRARIVIVGFCEPPVTKLLPSTTNRFLMSWL